MAGTYDDALGIRCVCLAFARVSRFRWVCLFLGTVRMEYPPCRFCFLYLGPRVTQPVRCTYSAQCKEKSKLYLYRSRPTAMWKISMF